MGIWRYSSEYKLSLYSIVYCFYNYSVFIFCTDLVYLRYVRRRNARTLLPLIRDHAAVGCEHHTDRWKAYIRINRIRRKRFRHRAVNHSRTFVDKLTGVHTQNIEALWSRVKRDFLKYRGVHRLHLNKYLDVWAFMNNMEKEGRNVWEELLMCIGQMQDSVQRPHN